MGGAPVQKFITVNKDNIIILYSLAVDLEATSSFCIRMQKPKPATDPGSIKEPRPHDKGIREQGSIALCLIVLDAYSVICSMAALRLVITHVLDLYSASAISSRLRPSIYRRISKTRWVALGTV